MFDHKSVMLM